jgi:hypothetical protein
MEANARSQVLQTHILEDAKSTKGARVEYVLHLYRHLLTVSFRFLQHIKQVRLA